MKELESIRDRIVSFSRLITDPKGTAFTIVLVPEKMAIVDTERALEMFEELGLKMSGDGRLFRLSLLFVVLMFIGLFSSLSL